MAAGDTGFAVHVPLQSGPETIVTRRRTAPSWQGRYIDAVVALDLAAALIAIGLVAAWRMLHGQSAVGSVESDVAGAALPAVWLVALYTARAYDARILGIGSEEYRRVLRAAVGVAALVGFIDYAGEFAIGRRFVLGAIPVTGSLCVLGRYTARKQLHRLRRQGRCRHRVVVLGHLPQVMDLTQRLQQEPHQGMDVVAACVPAEQVGTAMSMLSSAVVGTLDDAVRTVRQLEADTVAVTASADFAGPTLRRIAWQLENTGAQLVVAPGLIEVAGPRLHIRPITGLPLLQVEHPQLSGGRRLLKTFVDRASALALIILLFPLLAAIGLLVRLTTPGPAVFRQTRVGVNGSTFTCFKFRTMVVNAEHLRAELTERNVHAAGVLFKIPDDPRITPVGRILRRYSLDELPQLFNVLLGSMSLVGPRPPLPDEVARYADDARRRLLVKPGLTGLWQVSGRSHLNWEESVLLDLRYVENWSLTLDLMIIWKTVSAVLRGEGAY